MNDPKTTHAHVARVVTAMLGLDDSNPWIVRRLVEHAARGVFTAGIDLRSELGDEVAEVVADALLTLNAPPFRKAGWVSVFDTTLMATEEAWLDPMAGDGARLLAFSPIVMALMLDRTTRSSVLYIDATEWSGVGEQLAQDRPWLVASAQPTA